MLQFHIATDLSTEFPLSFHSDKLKCTVFPYEMKNELQMGHMLCEIEAKIRGFWQNVSCVVCPLCISSLISFHSDKLK